MITTSTSHIDLTVAKALEENQNIAFIGTQKGGKFDIKYDLAKKMLDEHGNPNGRPNSDIVRPWLNGTAITNFVLKKKKQSWPKPAG